MKYSIILVPALILFMCVGCSNDYKVNEIIVYPTECEVEQGDSVMINAAVDYSGGDEQNIDLVKIDWKSSDDGIATVVKGKVNGISVGDAKVTVSCEDKTAVCEVHVVPATPKDVGGVNN